MDIHVINKLKFSLSKPPFISFIIAIFALLFAFYLQYILGHEPCKLCMYQRYVYILVILLSLLGFFLHKSKLIPILLIILFIIITSIGFWHLGIEQQWWAASLECSGITENIGSLKEELKNINNRPVATCDQVSPKFLNITLVQWSFIYALVSSIFLTILNIKLNIKKDI
tara:strand:- start:10146 stop:10655 length:510 start_codon:yes stop_codon:yes gene_type:complete